MALLFLWRYFYHGATFTIALRLPSRYFYHGATFSKALFGYEAHHGVVAQHFDHAVHEHERGGA